MDEPLEKDNARISVEEVYEIAPGIRWIYYDFDSSTMEFTVSLPENFVEINYCKGGKFDCEFPTHSVGRMVQGSFAINMHKNPTTRASFPLEHYTGITLLLDMDLVETNQILPTGYALDLPTLWNQLCPGKHCFFLQNDPIIQSIFEPLYELSPQTKIHMHLVKWWELLLYLSDPKTKEKEEKGDYLAFHQVEHIKEIEEFLILNLQRRLTTEEVAAHFSMSPSSLKDQFQAVFGKPISSYMREYRCHSAALILRQNDTPIAQIATQMGYANASKFSAAFSSLYGVSPSVYRKNSSLFAPYFPKK